ncbi:MAG: Gamma-glutamyltranspeptidase @ Glutathione hydrolase, partial [uncultured Friedmanniella sp.]
VHRTPRVPHPTRPPRHLRDGRHDPLDRQRHRAGRAGARRQRLRRRRRRGLRAAPGRAPPQRPGRGHDRPRRHRRRPRPAGARRPGAGAPRGDPGALRGGRAGPRAGRRRPGRGRARCRRRVAAAAPRPRHLGAGRRLGLHDRLRRAGLPAGAAGGRHRRLGPRALHRPVAHLGGLLAGRRAAAARLGADDEPGLRPGAARDARRRPRRRHPGGAGRRRAARVADGPGGADGVGLPGGAAPALRRPGPRRRAHRGGLRRPRRHLGAGDHRGVPGLDGGEDGRLGPGAGAAAGADHPRRLPRRGARPADGRRRPPPAGGAQAGDGRPGGLLRRPGRRGGRAARPARGAAVRRLRGRPAGPDHRPGVDGGPAGRGAGPPGLPRPPDHRLAGPVRGGRGRADRVAGRRDPRRHLPPRRRRPLGQHGRGHPVGRLAAVLPAHPRAGLLPGVADADGLARPGLALGAASRPPAADHPHPDAAAARRGPGVGARHPRRRPAGPVAAGLPRPGARRRLHPAAGHRRP